MYAFKLPKLRPQDQSWQPAVLSIREFYKAFSEEPIGNPEKRLAAALLKIVQNVRKLSSEISMSQCINILSASGLRAPKRAFPKDYSSLNNELEDHWKNVAVDPTALNYLYDLGAISEEKEAVLKIKEFREITPDIQSYKTDYNVFIFFYDHYYGFQKEPPEKSLS